MVDPSCGGMIPSSISRISENKKGSLHQALDGVCRVFGEHTNPAFSEPRNPFFHVFLLHGLFVNWIKLFLVSGYSMAS